MLKLSAIALSVVVVLWVLYIAVMNRLPAADGLRPYDPPTAREAVVTDPNDQPRMSLDRERTVSRNGRRYVTGTIYNCDAHRAAEFVIVGYRFLDADGEEIRIDTDMRRNLGPHQSWDFAIPIRKDGTASHVLEGVTWRYFDGKTGQL